MILSKSLRYGKYSRHVGLASAVIQEITIMSSGCVFLSLDGVAYKSTAYISV